MYQPRRVSMTIVLFLFALYSMRPAGFPEEASISQSDSGQSAESLKTTPAILGPDVK